MNAWHAGLRQLEDLPDQQWNAHPDIKAFQHDDSLNSTRWSIEQLLTVRQLQEEGQRLRHCVLSYAKDCLADSTTIWSFSVCRGKKGKFRKKLTIEVTPDSRVIRQVRGKGNRPPKYGENSVIQKWAALNGLKY